MEPHALMTTAATLFGIAALGGLVMAGIRFSSTVQPPAWLAMLHGLLAAAGLTLLAYAAFTVGVPKMAQAALGLLVIAAAGGIVLNLVFHWNDKPLPISIMLVHAALAVLGFILLLMAL